jgi:hypothetical protein
MLFRFLGFQGFFFPRLSSVTGRAGGGIASAQASGDARALRRLVSVSGVGLGSARGRVQRQLVPGLPWRLWASELACTWAYGKPTPSLKRQQRTTK